MILPIEISSLASLADVAVNNYCLLGVSILKFLVVSVAAIILKFSCKLCNTKLKTAFKGKIDEILSRKFKRIALREFEAPEALDSINEMKNKPDEKLLESFSSLITIVTLVGELFSLSLLFSRINTMDGILYLILAFLVVAFDLFAMNSMNRMLFTQSRDERKMKSFQDNLTMKESLYELRVYGKTDFILDNLNQISSKVLSQRLKTTIRSQRYSWLGRLISFAWIALMIFQLVRGYSQSTISMGLFVSLAGSIPLSLSVTELLSSSFSVFSRILSSLGTMKSLKLFLMRMR